MNISNQKVLFPATVLAGGLMAANFVNLLFNAWLGRVVTPEEFGIIALINTFMYIGAMFYNALGATVVREVGFIETHKDSSTATAFFTSFSKQVLTVNLGLSLLWVLAVPFTSAFFHINTPIIFYLFTPLLILYPLVALGRGYLQGRLFFTLTGILIFIEPVIKLISAWFLLNFNLEPWIYTSIYISAILTGIIAITLAYSKKPAGYKSIRFPFPHKFFWASFLAGVSTISFLALDMVLVKHFLSPLEAGQYAFLSLLGKIIYFLGSLLNVFTISLVSREMNKDKNPYISFYSLFGFSAFLSLIGVLALGVFGNLTIPLIFGSGADAIIPYSLLYTIAISLFTLGNIIITYHLARKEYLFPFISLGFAALLTMGILNFNQNLTQIVYVLFIVGFIYSIVLAITHIYKHRLTPGKVKIKSLEQNLEESI